jgi:hypothetical protein
MTEELRAFYEADSLATEIYDVLSASIIPGGPMDGAVHPAAPQQGVVGGIDDGIHRQCCDIGLDDFDDFRHGPSTYTRSCFNFS